MAYFVSSTMDSRVKRDLWYYVTFQPECGIDYLLGSYALENIKDAERKKAKGALSSLYRQSLGPIQLLVSLSISDLLNCTALVLEISMLSQLNVY